VDEALGLTEDERALLCVLMLRGPQTLGELKQHSERLHPFADLTSVEEALDRLTARELVQWLERRPGQKEARYAHLLQGVDPGEAEAVAAAPSTAEEESESLTDEVGRLRSELDALKQEVATLREQLGGAQSPEPLRPDSEPRP
jgi:uncharacterized protein YceH (UPF0502 family)